MKKESRITIAKRIAEELLAGDTVNLGVGIPTLIPEYLGGKKVELQSENGLLGIGPTPKKQEVNLDLISASKEPVTMNLGAALFDSADSFVMIRGGHVDVAVMGTLQINRHGEIANWSIPGKDILGVGGAMDLVSGAKRIIIASMHQAKDGQPKFVEELTYPSSGYNKAEMLVTEHAVFKFTEEGPVLLEQLSDLTLNELKKITGALFSERTSFVN